MPDSDEGKTVNRQQSGCLWFTTAIDTDVRIFI